MTKKRVTDRLKGSDAWERLDYERSKRRSTAGIVSAALDGDLECAQQMLQIAAVAVWDADQIPLEVRSYVVDALEAMVTGEDPAKAFHLKRKTDPEGHRVNLPLWLRDAAMANGVALHIADGLDKIDAIRKVALQYSSVDDPDADYFERVADAYNKFYPEGKG